MKVDAEHIFAGANITDSNNENFTVIKVNAKSFYAAKGVSYNDYLSMFDNRIKGTTFKKFCELHDFKMYKFDDSFNISEEELSKKNVISQTKNVNFNTLGKAEKLVLSNLVKYNKVKKLANIQVGNNVMRILDYRDKDKFLLNLDSNYILYNSSLDVSYKICSVYDWGERIKEIPWDKITPDSKKE